MIKVDRTAVAAPAVLVDPSRAGSRETKRVLAFYLKNKGRAPTFAAYKDVEVKAALDQLFKKKCAYCEGPLQAFGPFPVEHWRPKGRVTLDDGTKLKRGYFWLAASWDNLFASCIDCNGERSHKEGSTGVVRLMGKLDRFPLADEHHRAALPGEEEKETPLLLNPCADNPSDHLEFYDPGGQPAILRARGDSAKGAKSIEVYALNRMGLVEERRKVLTEIRLLTSWVNSNLLLLETHLTPAQELIVLAAIKQALQGLLERRSSSTSYSAYARHEMDGFLVPLLQRFGLPPLPP